ncbi:HAD-IIIC family phosphatase [Phenylobacterium sp.]|uniref:HAD-IIIC family phosphatase n=1 Tax=Phenylobacterium sp. TaxID=1871053 RepID=UPI0035659F50
MNKPVLPEPDPLATLADPVASLAQVMAAVEAAEALGGQPASAHIGISAGATVDLLGLYLRRHALLAGVRLQVSQGNFDDPMGDLTRFAERGVDHLLLAPFLDTLEPAFEARAAMLSDLELDAREVELRGRWRLVLQGAAGFRTVFLCGLHRMTAPVAGGDRLDAVLARLNQALRDEAAAFANVRWIDMAAMVGGLGRKAALDLRFYLRNAAPYAPALLDEWARQLSAVSRAYGTRFFKALVLDCDNTLWGGVLGEDLASGIKLSPNDYPGSVFHRAQTEFLALQRQGVLLCLCSKNDAAEVDALLDSHPDMVLRQVDIIAKQVNWDDKVANLRQLAQDLNISLDSLVFLDDSAFECEAVRSQLPEVTVFQAPASPPDYLAVIAAIKDLFLAGGAATEGAEKTEQYRKRAETLAARQTFDSQEDYLASLGLTVTLAKDDAARIPRIAELSQKSNQFNLTTTRYTPGDIEGLMADPAAAVWSLEVADKFGAAGLTGVAVVRYAGEVATLESLFMSCRVLGRGIEFVIWPTIFADAEAHGCTRVDAAYRPTSKNGQAADFYDRLGLPLTGEADGARTYAAELAGFTPPPSSWIKVLHD